ncbi:MAG: hypothetical protein HUU32_13155 [Calditrichaceae bacterium]|nr:hypothetical protein [Calditrichia bacterium]NUQ42335.1 hypothetical protein [Calditrichaceae bacterium]
MAIYQMLAILILLAAALAGFHPLAGQVATLPFHSPQFAEKVDYHSFAPALLLQHHIPNRFQKLPKNPVLTPTRGSWDSKDVADPFVAVTADSILLFYDGDDNDRYHIGYAVQDSLGWGWQKRGLILGGSGEEWDSFHQIAPAALLQPERWLLYYNGNREDSELGYQWGLALRERPSASAPLGEWRTAQNGPLLALDSTNWDFAGNAYGDVLWFPEEGKYRMWYTGFQGPLASIGLAESFDGLRWEKRGEGPALALFPGVIAPEVIFNGESYAMYFVQLEFLRGGMATKICRAESRDGIAWENVQDALLPTERWERRRLMRPNLSYFEGRVQLYYCAGGGSWSIGAASAEAQFESAGVWRSRTVQGEFTRLGIKYEQPPETVLTVSLVDAASQKVYPCVLEENRTMLRKDVYCSQLAVPAGLLSGSWQAEARLSTARPDRSPVVYEIVLVP